MDFEVYNPTSKNNLRIRLPLQAWATIKITGFQHNRIFDNIFEILKIKETLNQT